MHRARLRYIRLGIHQNQHILGKFHRTRRLKRYPHPPNHQRCNCSQPLLLIALGIGRALVMHHWQPYLRFGLLQHPHQCCMPKGTCNISSNIRIFVHLPNTSLETLSGKRKSRQVNMTPEGGSEVVSFTAATAHYVPCSPDVRVACSSPKALLGVAHDTDHQVHEGKIGLRVCLALNPHGASSIHSLPNQSRPASRSLDNWLWLIQPSPLSR